MAGYIESKHGDLGTIAASILSGMSHGRVNRVPERGGGPLPRPPTVSDVMPEWVEVGWTDRDGDHGHVIIGTGLRDLSAAPGTVARITVRPAGSDVSYPVDLPREHAETLHAALGRYLEEQAL